MAGLGNLDPAMEVRILLPEPDKENSPVSAEHPTQGYFYAARSKHGLVNDEAKRT